MMLALLRSLDLQLAPARGNYISPGQSPLWGDTNDAIPKARAEDRRQNINRMLRWAFSRMFPDPAGTAGEAHHAAPTCSSLHVDGSPLKSSWSLECSSEGKSLSALIWSGVCNTERTFCCSAVTGKPNMHKVSDCATFLGSSTFWQDSTPWWRSLHSPVGPGAPLPAISRLTFEPLPERCFSARREFTTYCQDSPPIVFRCPCPPG